MITLLGEAGHMLNFGILRALRRSLEVAKNFHMGVRDREIGAGRSSSARSTPTSIIPQVAPVVNPYFKKNKKNDEDFIPHRPHPHHKSYGKNLQHIQKEQPHTKYKIKGFQIVPIL